MPPRWIEYEARQWTVTALAREYHLSPSTFRHRVDRFGTTASGLHRALCTGVLDCRAAGRIGALRSPWKFIKNFD